MDLKKEFIKFIKTKEVINNETKIASSNTFFSNSISLVKNFSFKQDDDKIFYLTESLYEIKKIKKLFKNYFKVQDKVLNINEFMSKFLSEKNSFVENMETFISKASPNSKDYYVASNFYKSLLNQAQIIFKSRIDEVMTSFKILKQKIIKKNSIYNRYWESKNLYIQKHGKILNNYIRSKSTIDGESKEKISVNIDENYKDKKEKKNQNFIFEENLNKADDTIIEPPKEKWALKYIPQETKTIDDTIKILNDLSNLMKTFTQKVYFHNEMTQQSIIFI